MSATPSDADTPDKAANAAHVFGAASILFALYLATALACIALPRESSRLAPLWLPNAFALTALLRRPMRHWPPILVVTVAANLTASVIAGHPPAACLAMSFGNLCEYTFAALALRRALGAEVRIERGEHLALLAAAAFGASLLAGVVTSALLAFVAGDPFGTTLRGWTLAHPLCLMMMTPSLLVISRAPELLRRNPVTRRGAAALCLLLATTAAVFAQTRAPISFLIPPLLLLVALEMGVLGAAFGVLAVAAVATLSTLVGHGPLALMRGDGLERDAALMLFLAVSLFSSLPVANLQARQQQFRREALAEAVRAARAEGEAEASKARYRLIADQAGDIIARLGLDGVFAYVSPSITAITGFADHEVIGRHVRTFVHPDDYKAVAIAFRDYVAGLRTDGCCEYRFQRKDGGWVWLEVNPKVLRDGQGAPTGYVDVARDITARKAMEAELQAARLAAEAAAQAKAEFLANMSHELRTPLTAVLGFANLLDDQPELSQTSRRHLDRVRTAGKSLLVTVNDVLDFSKLEAGQVEFASQPASPAALIGEVLDLFAVQGDAKGLALSASGLLTLPDTVEIDADRVRQVLVNLVGNAVKFTDAGGVTVSASWRGGRLRCAIADTGPGVPEDRVCDLFQRFSQVDGSNTRRHGGTGLGLAICKGLVEAMDGEIGVESRLGEGSTFHFEIAAPAHAAAALPPEASRAAIESLPRGARVLVVDDSAANRELVASLLSSLELEVTLAQSGAEAVAVASTLVFDAVMMDLRMPGLGGAEAANLIRHGTANTATPIIAFSADVMSDLSSFDGVVSKPILAAELLGVLAAQLSAQGARDAA